ncbi:ParB N-terminal domain-containing protein, partial [Verrucomicrobiota bacterium]
MKIVKVKLSQIKGTVYQPRSQPDLELENLVRSIINNGMVTPLTVRETGSNGCKRVTGSRRYEACLVIETNIHPLSLPPGAASIGPDGKVILECVVLPA